MIDQKRVIEKVAWDYLLVLDACRFDYFEKTYSDYLTGRLEKSRSPVTCENGVATSEWCKVMFRDKYEDIIYISTTPHVNSKIEVNGFEAAKHFYKVVDLWDHGWNEDMGTVFPERVNESIKKIKNKNPTKRIIAHYMQPHFPYLSLKNPTKPKSKDPASHDTLKRNIRNFFGSKIRRTLGGNLTRRIIKTLRLPPVNPMHEVLYNLGREGLKEAYENNLRRALDSISKISGEFSGEVIITADHGEYLGENGFYGHSYLPNHPVLNTVPWMTLDV